VPVCVLALVSGVCCGSWFLVSGPVWWYGVVYEKGVPSESWSGPPLRLFTCAVLLSVLGCFCLTVYLVLTCPPGRWTLVKALCARNHTSYWVACVAEVLCCDP